MTQQEIKMRLGGVIEELDTLKVNSDDMAETYIERAIIDLEDARAELTLKDT